MKRLITGTALAAGYIFLCYWQRGYLNLMSDLIVIVMATAAYLILDKMSDKDQQPAQADDEPTYIKVARSTHGIRKHVG